MQICPFSVILGHFVCMYVFYILRKIRTSLVDSWWSWILPHKKTSQFLTSLFAMPELCQEDGNEITHYIALSKLQFLFRFLPGMNDTLLRSLTIMPVVSRVKVQKVE